VPTVATLAALDRAAADFEVTDLPLDIEPPAREAAQRSLADSGMLLLGEVHGVSRTRWSSAPSCTPSTSVN
jgi:hypothetical protein